MSRNEFIRLVLCPCTISEAVNDEYQVGDLRKMRGSLRDHQEKEIVCKNGSRTPGLSFIYFIILPQIILPLPLHIYINGITSHLCL